MTLTPCHLGTPKDFIRAQKEQHPRKELGRAGTGRWLSFLCRDCHLLVDGDHCSHIPGRGSQGETGRVLCPEPLLRKGPEQGSKLPSVKVGKKVYVLETPGKREWGPRSCREPASILLGHQDPGEASFLHPEPQEITSCACEREPQPDPPALHGSFSSVAAGKAPSITECGTKTIEQRGRDQERK